MRQYEYKEKLYKGRLVTFDSFGYLIDDGHGDGGYIEIGETWADAKDYLDRMEVKPA